MSRRWSPRGVQFIGVVTRDSGGAARAFVSKHKITYPVVVDSSGATASDYGVPALPATFVISSTGTVVAHMLGSVDARTLDVAIRRALTAKAKASSR
jgi:peroxiredoxin